MTFTVDETLTRAPRNAVDYRLDEFALNPAGRSIKPLDIAEAVVDASLDLTVEGASTVEITVQDTNLELLRGEILTGWAWGKNADDRDEAHWIMDGRVVDARLDDLAFRLVKIVKQNDQLTLTFEDREVARLRLHRGARKAYRDKVTRAEFVKMLCDEAGVTLHAPHLHVRQPITNPLARLSPAQRREKAGQGFDRGVRLKGKGVLGPGQVRNAERVLDVAYATPGFTAKATLALIEACIVEGPDFKNPVGGEGTSSGILQLTAGKPDRRNIESVVRRFMTVGFTGRGGAIELSRKHPSWSPGQIAQAVQGSKFPARYEQYRDEAEKILREYGGLLKEGATYTVNKRYAFARGKNETSWDCIQRLAEEVGWRAFVRKGRLWYVSEEQLFAQKPEMTMLERKGGVETVDFEIDVGARNLVAELTVTAYADRWTALPGMVARAKEVGPADGRWIVNSIRRSFWQDAATVTLRKPIRQKPEPAPETAEISVRGGKSGGGGGANGALSRLMGVMRYISAHTPGYGHGQHGISPRKMSASRPHDCSSAVHHALFEAGLMTSESNWVSGTFASSYGNAGPGRLFTVWANGGHVFIQGDGWRFDTGGPGGGQGPKFRRATRGTAGFTPRHFPGM